MAHHERQMHLCLSIQGAGYHYGAWRLPSAPANPDTDIDFYIRLAKAAEKSKLDAVFFADWLAVRENIQSPGTSRLAGLGRLEPITALAALSSVTSHIGLVGTISTSFFEPYTIARIIGSLDHISKGRAGWNVVTSWSDAEAKNYGSDKLMAHPDRYARSREFLDVVFGLWDSWEPDAIVRDRTSGVYFDPSKVRPLDHRGEHFAVRGPLNLEPPPQGRPVISQAGMSHDGQELAAATANMIFALSGTVAEGKQYYDSVKGRMAKYGRHPDELNILPGVMPIVGRTEDDARERHRQLAEGIDEEVGLSLLSSSLGDLRGLPLDKPIPNPPKPDTTGSMRNMFLELAHKGKTIRELYRLAAERNWRPPVGTASTIADYMEERFVGGAADGFNILSADAPAGSEEFFELVVPELQRRGLFRTEYTANTLRGHLGLPAHQNRHQQGKVGAA